MGRGKDKIKFAKEHDMRARCDAAGQLIYEELERVKKDEADPLAAQHFGQMIFYKLFQEETL